MYCDHSQQLGDNYGISCQRCGVALEGYGYGGFLGNTGDEQCVHRAWYRVSGNEEECVYCHSRRPTPLPD